jgi:hypothetical integral membrane protein (TIGR02206 family)
LDLPKAHAFHRRPSEGFEALPSAVVDQFRIFSFPHIILLGLIPLLAAGLAWWTQASDRKARSVRISLGILLMLNELAWYGYYVWQGWFVFPYSLPLQLCDILVWIAIAAALTSSQRTYELLYYWGLAGTTMALLTPDVTTSTFSYLTIRFFVSHGGIIVVILFLTWRRVLRPTRGSNWRALLGLHIYAIFIAAFDYAFDANFFYLLEKPTEASLLDYMGPWPVYILVGDLLALTLFWLLWLPFRSVNR